MRQLSIHASAPRRTLRPLLVLALLVPGVGRGQGSITEFPVPTAASRPYTIVAGPDGNLWFTESNGNKIGRITPAGAITEYPVPTAGSGPYGIAIGPDGKVWFTERFADKIGRLDPATGQIVEFPTPTSFSQPWEIALGADGNLWFTEEDVNQIGRITPQGIITELVPPSCCFPTGIAPGPDGNVWFTIEIGDWIGKVEPSGAMTTFQIPSVQVLPWDIAPGLDGNVWFTELAGRNVGTITPGGGITELPIPGAFSGIAGITAGHDGNYFFTENDTHQVSVLDPSGTVLQTFATGDRPLSIAAGPDGNLWFTEADANAIGRLSWAQAGRAYVLSMDAGFAPRIRSAGLGETVQWTFFGPRAHAVADSSGLSLFDSGAKRIVSYHSFTFTAAGGYPYRDALQSGSSGLVSVPLQLPSAGSAGVPFTVTWAVQPPPPGLAFDVQVKPPGSGSFALWMTTTAVSADYTATSPGIYQFRARLRDPLTGKAVLYSRPGSIPVN